MDQSHLIETQSADELRITRVETELRAESITLRIRWFGLCIGYILVNVEGLLNPSESRNQPALNAILTLGAVYAVIDTWWSAKGKVFLSEFRLAVSTMEALFIGLLCFFDDGVPSPFRFYYFLSLLDCGIRHSPSLTFTTFGLHSLSY